MSDPHPTSPETRIVKQGTHTRYKPLAPDSAKGNVSAFAKQAVLTAVFDQANVTALILAKLQVPRGKDDKLIQAVRALHSPGSGTAAALLAAVSLDAVTAFANEGIKVEEELSQAAHEELTKTVAGFNAAGAAPPGNKGAPKSNAGPLQDAFSSLLHGRPSVGSTPIQSALAQASPTAHQYFAGLGDFPFPAPVPAGVSTPQSASMQALQARDRRRFERKRALVAQLVHATAIEPVGFLHLERLEFTPAGYRRGDLVYSVPLLPGESTQVTHREWSRSETEITKLVATTLETAVEDVLAEKSELTQTVSTQRQQAETFNASLTATGTLGPINFSATAGANASSTEQGSHVEAAHRSREMTRTASSRAKEEHKVTFKQDVISETEDISVRQIRNDTDQAVRWDYYRLMRCWQVKLFRYGVRLTYDVVIPEPASYLLRKYRALGELTREINKPFTPPKSMSDIREDTLEELRAQWNVALEPAPLPYVVASGHKELTFENNPDVHGFDFVDLVLPDGYYFDPRSITADAAAAGETRGVLTSFNGWGLVGSIVAGGPPLVQVSQAVATRGELDALYLENARRLVAAPMSQYAWRFSYHWLPGGVPNGEKISMYVELRGLRSQKVYDAWQAAQYQKFVAATREANDERVAALTRRRNALQMELAALETLDLRKIEREEIMKGVLRWLVGPTFDFFGQLASLADAGGDDAEFSDLDIYRNALGSVEEAAWKPYLAHGDLIRFIHEAVEWENMAFILYPYFWTDEGRWDFKQSLQHNELQHMSFLKAGAARVVITIRPGWEDAWLGFMANPERGVPASREHPYRGIMEDLEALANQYSQYEEAANPEAVMTPVREWREFTPTGALDVARGDALSADL